MIRIRNKIAEDLSLARVAQAAAITSVCLGILVMAGFWLDVTTLHTLWPGRPQMYPFVPVGFVLLGCGLWLMLPEARKPSLGYRAGQVLAAIATLLGLAMLAECLGWYPGIELKAFGDPAPGDSIRPAFTSAACAIALGLGIALLDVRVRGLWLAQVASVTTSLVAMLALIGHVFGVAELYGSLDFEPSHGMAVHTAAGFLFLGIGVLCARPRHGLVALMRSRTPGGTLARRWMFMPGLVLLAMGVVYWTLNTGLAAPRALASWAIFMTSLTVLTAAVWTTAKVLHEAGLQREAVQHILEKRVRERTAELKEANDALNAAKEELARANQDLEAIVQERTRHLKDTIRALETVCYNIAHDLRAPNRAIAGFAQVILTEHSRSLDPGAIDGLQRIAKAAQRSDALTLDLLAYGRLGHADLPCSRQSLQVHVDAILEQLSQEIAARRASVRVEQPLPDVWANPEALEQVLFNLLTNALKFVADSVPPNVVIRAEDAGDRYRVLVHDNGIGIPAEHQQNIFGVFQRLHPPDKYPGSGIGLAIVQKGIERMDGKVGVVPEVKNGSCFWFELKKP